MVAAVAAMMMALAKEAKKKLHDHPSFFLELVVATRAKKI